MSETDAQAEKDYYKHIRYFYDKSLHILPEYNPVPGHQDYRSLVNSVNQYRIEGQKTASFEIVDVLGDAPDVHCIPVGNAGNITAYWKGFVEARDAKMSKRRPQMHGFQAAGAAPIVNGEVVVDPQTIATAIRIGSPASWKKTRDGATRASVTAEILKSSRPDSPRPPPTPAAPSGRHRRGRPSPDRAG